jgi:hypothetical protein
VALFCYRSLPSRPLAGHRASAARRAHSKAAPAAATAAPGPAKMDCSGVRPRRAAEQAARLLTYRCCRLQLQTHIQEVTHQVIYTRTHAARRARAAGPSSDRGSVARPVGAAATAVPCWHPRQTTSPRRSSCPSALTSTRHQFEPGLPFPGIRWGCCCSQVPVMLPANDQCTQTREGIRGQRHSLSSWPLRNSLSTPRV